MKLLKSPDCEVTSPPSTCFIMLPEAGFESDLAFIAELVDLPTANRAAKHLWDEGIREEEKIKSIITNGRTSRIAVQSLAAHLEGSPSGTPEYAKTIIQAALEDFGIDEQTLLSKAFWVRTFWF